MLTRKCQLVSAVKPLITWRVLLAYEPAFVYPGHRPIGKDHLLFSLRLLKFTSSLNQYGQNK